MLDSLQDGRIAKDSNAAIAVLCTSDFPVDSGTKSSRRFPPAAPAGSEGNCRPWPRSMRGGQPGQLARRQRFLAWHGISLLVILCLAHKISDRPTGGSARKALHFPARGINCTPRAMNCCPRGMSSTLSAKSGCSTGINSTPHAMSSTRSAIHWLASGIHSTSTAINSTRTAMNAPKWGVDSTPNPIHSCRSATGEDSDCTMQTIRRHPGLWRVRELGMLPLA